MIDKKLYVGKVVMVFDAELWRKNRGDSETDTFMRKATVLKLHSQTEMFESALVDYVDVRFEHDGRISKSHFPNTIEEYNERQNT